MGKRTRKQKRDGDRGRMETASSGGWPSWLRGDWCLGLVLFVLVFPVYQSIGNAGFVWDDDNHLTANPCIVGPLGFKDIWTTSLADISPFTRSTFWLEHALWGLAPRPYHIINVLLHGGCAVLLWRVLRQLAVPGAWLGAALWELHPVEVESVAWVSEMKNTESGLFFLLAVLLFGRWLKQDPATRGKLSWNYAFTLLFGALAMASKSSTVVLPAVLCLCVWWIEGRWNWRRLPWIIPLFLMSALSALLAIWTQRLVLATDIGSQWVRTWPERFAAAGDAVWFYCGKLLWPQPLMAVYPRWHIDGTAMISYLPLLAVIVVLGIFWLNRDSWGRAWLFAFGYFLVALLPALGLIDGTIFRHSLVFDHFQYLASMGPLALAAAGLKRLADFIPARRWLPPVAQAGLLLLLGVLSHRRAYAYESDETLWVDTLSKNPSAWVAHYNLANDLGTDGRTDEAVEQYRKTLELYPNFALAHNNLANALLQQGNLGAAFVEFRKSLQIDPGYADAHYNFGNALMKSGQVEEAIAQFRAALALSPQFVEARINLGNALVQKGRIDEAIGQLQTLVDRSPDSAEGHLSLGNAFFLHREVDAAIRQYRWALDINPGYASAHNNLGLALAQNGRTAEAIAEFQEALRLQPDYTDARQNLTDAESRQRQGAVSP